MSPALILLRNEAPTPPLAQGNVRYPRRTRPRKAHPTERPFSESYINDLSHFVDVLAL